jgi:hypothetical protein
VSHTEGRQQITGVLNKELGKMLRTNYVTRSFTVCATHLELLKRLCHGEEDDFPNQYILNYTKLQFYIVSYAGVKLSVAF